MGLTVTCTFWPVVGLKNRPDLCASVGTLVRLVMPAT